MKFTVTEPKYLNNIVATSDPPGSSKEEKQTAYHDELENTDSANVDESPSGDSYLLQSLPPILNELNGDEPGTL